MENNNSNASTYLIGENCQGLTKREYFAAIALQGIITRIDFLDFKDYQKEETPEMYIERKCKVALIITDEFLKQLELKK